MRLGHVRHHSGVQLFAEDDACRILVRDVLPEAPETLDELVQRPGDWVDRISEALEEAGASPSDGAAAGIERHESLAPPLLRPRSVIAIGLNYADHCREFGTTPPDSPVIFTKLPQSVCGAGDSIVWSTGLTNSVDWEAELAVVIGRPTRGVSEAEALDAVFGYTVVNDVTARDVQAAEHQWVRSKSLETFCPIGPAVVPSPYLPDPQSLLIRSRLNGVTMQDSTTAEMIFTVAELISYLSRSFTLVPGDVIATGTPLGVGAFRSPPVFLHDGDLIEVEVEGIGTLRNTCRELESSNRKGNPEHVRTAQQS